MTELSPDQRRALTLALRAAQWLLDDVAHDLPANRVTPQRWAELDEALTYLHSLVRQQSRPGEAPGTTSGA